MSGIYYVGALLGLSVITPLILFEVGKCSVRYRLKKNIEELKEIQKNSSDEITELINIHLEELEKCGIFKGLK